MEETAGSDVLLDRNDTWSNGDEWKEDEVPTKCPFCNEVMSSAFACFQHTKAVHSFDFHVVRKEMGKRLDCNVFKTWTFLALCDW